MSANLEPAPVKPLSFRRYKEGDHKPLAWQQEIFDADHSHKCPTYIQSTPPCQGSCPSGEDIRGYLNIVRGGSKASNPSALILDTGEKLVIETLRGAKITESKIDIGEPVTYGEDMEDRDVAADVRRRILALRDGPDEPRPGPDRGGAACAPHGGEGAA